MNIIGICGKAGSGKDTIADHLVKKHVFIKVALADPLKRICKDVFDFSDEQLWGPSEERNKPDPRYPVKEHDFYLEDDNRESVQKEGLCSLWRCNRCRRLEEGPVGRVTHYSESKCALTPRHALQQLGTEWGRNCYPNVWVDYALRTAKQLLATTREYWYDQQRGMQRQTLPNCLGFKGVVIPDVRFQNEVDAIRAAGGSIWKVQRPVSTLSGSTHASETEQDTIPNWSFSKIIVNDKTLGALFQDVDEEMKSWV